MGDADDHVDGAPAGEDDGNGEVGFAELVPVAVKGKRTAARGWLTRVVMALEKACGRASVAYDVYAKASSAKTATATSPSRGDLDASVHALKDALSMFDKRFDQLENAQQEVIECLVSHEDAMLREIDEAGEYEERARAPKVEADSVLSQCLSLEEPQFKLPSVDGSGSSLSAPDDAKIPKITQSNMATKQCD